MIPDRLFRRIIFVVLACLLASVGPAHADPAPSGDLPGKDVVDKVRGNLVKDDVAKHLPPGFLEGPSPDDVTFRMLRMLLGDPAVTALAYYDKKGKPAGGVTAVTMMLGLFPFIALVMASVLMVYLFVGGMFSTTTTGELLGRRWDTWTVPLRSSTAYLLLMPAPPFAPFSGVQIITLGLVLFGTGAAGSVFHAVAKYMVSAPLVMVQNDSAPEFVKSVTNAALCVALESKKSNDAMRVVTLQDRRKSAILERYTSQLKKQQSSTNAWRFDFGPDGKCGSISMDPPAKGDNSLLSDKIAYALKVRIYNAVVGSGGSPGIVQNTFTAALRDIALPLVKESRSKDKKQIKISVYARRFDKIVQSVQAQLHKAATEAGSFAERANNAEFADSLSRYGFATAGTLYWSLARRQSAFVEAINTALVPVDTPFVGEIKNVFRSIFSSEDSLIQKQRTSLAGKVDLLYSHYLRTYRPRGGLDELVTKNSNEGGILRGMGLISSWFGKTLSDLPRFFSGTSADNPDPLLEIKTLGHVLQDAGAGLLAAQHVPFFGSLLGGGGGSKDKGFLSKAVSFVASPFTESLAFLVNIIITVSLLLGFLYANVIPAIPYVMWLAAILGYLVYVMESLIAVNFWAAMHSHPDGEGFVGRAGAGYPILMTLILYPIFMIAGLVIGMAIVKVGGWFVNITVWPYLRDMNSGGINILSVLGNLVIFGLAYLIVVYKSFSLTYALPQAVLRWMGVGASFTDLGEEDAKNKALSVAGVATSHLSRSVAGGRFAAG